MKRELIDSAATASLLGISPATVRNWCRSGYLKPAGKQKGRLLFDREEVENLLKEIRSNPAGRLNSRANKSTAVRTFIPGEYLRDRSEIQKLQAIADHISSEAIDIHTSLLLLAMNLLVREKLLPPVTLQELRQQHLPRIRHSRIETEIRSWLETVDTASWKDSCSFLLSCDLPPHNDLLGIVYQSILPEGEKARKGSYYTPANLVEAIGREYVRKDSRILDPSCGTGQFLLIFSEITEQPENLYGFDIDAVAVRIARLNLLLRFKKKTFTPNIFQINTLFDPGNTLFSPAPLTNIKFDLIATNPPWGVHFTKAERERLSRRFPEITSLESFSYFLKAGADLLAEGGILSYLLPESILNVKTHRDIRKILLRDMQIRKIVWLDRVFSNVFTPVIRMDLARAPGKKHRVVIVKDNQEHLVPQERWLHNPEYLFDIHINDLDGRILEKVYNTEYTTLKDQAEWALGIVTGNNRKFVHKDPQAGDEPVFRGKDVDRFVLKEPSGYLHFTPGKFQQVAPEEKYRAKEKLIYRFISKYLVFAWDDRQRLTLNSANIVIPHIPGYPLKAIAALFNSSLYQFIYHKKFTSLKILRGHLEQLPLPLWEDKTLNRLSRMADEIIKKQKSFEELDRYIMQQFNIREEEKEYILEVSLQSVA